MVAAGPRRRGIHGRIAAEDVVKEVGAGVSPPAAERVVAEDRLLFSPRPRPVVVAGEARTPNLLH